MFNLKTGKVEGCGNFWRADDWIHMNIDCGMLSLLMPEAELLSFIKFLAFIPLHKYGYTKNTKKYTYRSEDHEVDHATGETTVNVSIGDNTLVILNITMAHIPAMISYLNEKLEG